MQSPGSSIKQQKLNVVSSRGTAAALAKQNPSRLTACHLWETPGTLGSLGKGWQRGEEHAVLPLTGHHQHGGWRWQLRNARAERRRPPPTSPPGHPHPAPPATMPDKVGRSSSTAPNFKQASASSAQTVLEDSHAPGRATREHPATRHRAPGPRHLSIRRGGSSQLQPLKLLPQSLYGRADTS